MCSRYVAAVSELRPHRSTAPSIAVTAFTIAAVAVLLVYGVRSIVAAVRDSSPLMVVTERLVRTGRLEPLKVEWDPSWTLSGLEDAPWQRSARVAAVDPRKGVMVVNLWASWCEPCRTELPSLIKLARAVPTANFVLIGYDEEWTSPEATFREIFGTVPRGVLIARDPLGKSGGDQDASTFWRRLGATGIPETFFVRDGVVVGKTVGAIDWAHPDVADFLAELTRT